MAISYQQTDTDLSGICGIAEYCSGLSANGGGDGVLASDGGSAGSGENVVTIDGNASDLRWFYFNLPVDADVSWDLGTWTVRINVTDVGANCTLSSIHICRVNAACTSQDTIGSATGLSDSLNATGVISTNVTGIAQTPTAGDLVMIVIGVSNSNSCTRTVGLTVDQIITSPFSPGGLQEIDSAETISTVAADLGAPFVEPENISETMPLIASEAGPIDAVLVSSEGLPVVASDSGAPLVFPEGGDAVSLVAGEDFELFVSDTQAEAIADFLADLSRLLVEPELISETSQVGIPHVSDTVVAITAVSQGDT